MEFRIWRPEGRPNLFRVYVNGIPNLSSDIKVFFFSDKDGFASLEVVGALWDTAYSIGDIVSMCRRELSVKKGLPEAGALRFSDLVETLGVRPSDEVRQPRMESYSESELNTLVQSIEAIGAVWQLESSALRSILGMPDSATALEIKHSSELERAGHLLGIYKVLRILYPRNPEIVESYLQTPIPELDDAVPLDIFYDEGTGGLRRVREHLLRRLNY